MDRTKKKITIQIFLFLTGLVIILFTYFGNESSKRKENQNLSNFKINTNNSELENIFYNVKYSNFDFSGNRYVINSEEAYTDKFSTDLIHMRKVKAFFYFKDGTDLKIVSDKGIYNNQTLDTSFEDNIKAVYDNSQLFADNAEFSNSNGYLIVSNSVKLKDSRGLVNADRLHFDIKNQTLNIGSSQDNKINADVNIK